MTIIKTGVWLELQNRRTNRILFSASTDELDKEIFDQLWSSIGDMVHRESMAGDASSSDEYQIRISRHTYSG